MSIRNKHRRFLHIIFVVLILLASLPHQTALALDIPHHKETNIEFQLSTLSPEEKVGQLFLITFNGNDTSEISTIYDLIVNYHIGGVVLERAVRDSRRRTPAGNPASVKVASRIVLENTVRDSRRRIIAVNSATAVSLESSANYPIIPKNALCYSRRRTRA